MNKRGILGKLYYVVMGFILAAVVFLAMIAYIMSVDKDTLIDKNFIARDIALVLTAIHAAPEDSILTYRYTMSQYDFRVKINSDSKTVRVSDGKGETLYWYGGDESVEVKKRWDSGELGDTKLKTIIFTKRPDSSGSVIEISKETTT